MKKGYQLIEPSLLDGVLAAPRISDIGVALLSWLIEAIRDELKDRLAGVHVELIRAEYHGPYPAIGIHYDDADSEDVGPLVEATADKLLRGCSVSEFASFVSRGGRDWRKEAEDLLGRMP